MINGSFVFLVGLTLNRSAVSRTFWMVTAAIGNGGLCGQDSPIAAGRQAEAARAAVGLVGWQPASLHSNCSSVTSLNACGTLGKQFILPALVPQL